jgi:hypothetical protein
MNAAPAPGLSWLLGVLVVALLVGGITTVVTAEDGPVRRTVVETTIREVVVLPEHQAEVTGTIDGFVADDAIGPRLAMPIELDSGRATVDGALVGGERSTIVWDGGRPLRLSGSGAIDLGPTHVEMGLGATYWSIDGLRILTPGTYRIDAPVAVGSGGLARPRDGVDFAADEETTIDTADAGLVGRGLPLHLEGPGTFEAEGSFRVRTRAGTVRATRIEFGPGPFLIDIAVDRTFTAVFNGPLSSS